MGSTAGGAPVLRVEIDDQVLVDGRVDLGTLGLAFDPAPELVVLCERSAAPRACCPTKPAVNGRLTEPREHVGKWYRGLVDRSFRLDESSVQGAQLRGCLERVVVRHFHAGLLELHQLACAGQHG